MILNCLVGLILLRPFGCTRCGYKTGAVLHDPLVLKTAARFVLNEIESLLFIGIRRYTSCGTTTQEGLMPHQGLTATY